MKNNLKENIMHAIFLIAALTSIIAVILICVFLFANGFPAIGKIGIFKFLLGKDWSPTDIPAVYGIAPMVLGSLYVTAGAILFGVPIGIITALFMARYCPNRLYKIIKPAFDLLAGIPSIVYGFFGLMVLVPITQNLFGGTGKSIFTASILLGIMILPTIISISEAAIRAVPESYYEGALGLGASHNHAAYSIVLPAARSGIFASVALGIGRAIGETMAVVMIAGNQARMPAGVFKGVRTLTANIVIEMGYAADLHREALIATGVVLFVFILLINLSFSLMKRRIVR
ncbi:MAG: phosphate ABC transporter permease subunit PstC [Clostridiales Family XIII bacterium]|nr:phosphate ABC transporter permease subunit PstC [Clostridiales Family XIII bacterium]